VLAEKYRLGYSVVEANERVFPIANMVAEPDVEYHVPKIEAIKVKPKRIDNVVSFIHRDQDSRSVTSATPIYLVFAVS
jgi:hypothetical protein